MVVWNYFFINLKWLQCSRQARRKAQNGAESEEETPSQAKDGYIATWNEEGERWCFKSGEPLERNLVQVVRCSLL